MKDIAENQTEQIKETAVSAEPDRETVTDSFPENISEKSGTGVRKQRPGVR